MSKNIDSVGILHGDVLNLAFSVSKFRKLAFCFSTFCYPPKTFNANCQIEQIFKSYFHSSQKNIHYFCDYWIQVPTRKRGFHKNKHFRPRIASFLCYDNNHNKQTTQLPIKELNEIGNRLTQVKPLKSCNHYLILKKKFD